MLNRNPSTPETGQDFDQKYIIRVLYIMLVAALLVTGVITLSALANGGRITLATAAVVFVVCLFLLWLTRQHHLLLPRILLPLIALTTAIFLMFRGLGVRDEAILLFPMAIVMAGLLLGKNGLVLYCILSLVAVAVRGWAEMDGAIVTEFSGETTLQTVITLDLLMAFVGVLLYTTVDNLTQGLAQARRRERELAVSNRELETVRSSLQEQVEERTRELARRTHYLEATATIAHETASVLSVQEVLDRVVTLVSEQFGFYHTGIFMLDSTHNWAVLQAASSEAGKRMLARGHRLQVGGNGLVAYVVSRGEPRIALNVDSDAAYFDNPDLPQTHSEMALPLRARGEIIGALDVQSTEPGAFRQEDIAALKTLADQVAMAISNAQLFGQARESLESERRAYGKLSGEGWKQLLQSEASLGYLYDQGALARLTGCAETEQENPAANAMPELKVQVKARGTVVGTVRAHKPGTAGEWTSEEIAMLESLADQLGLALESARLYQDTQRRAAREQLRREITDRMRRATSIDNLFRTTLQEMTLALNVQDAFVQLLDPAEPAGSGNGSAHTGEAGQ